MAINQYYVVRFLKNEEDRLGIHRWVCFKVGKLFTDEDVISGRQYLNDLLGVDISCGFSTEEAADMHIRFPICYPDDDSAMEVLNAPFDRAGWICFWNPVSGINDPENAVALKKSSILKNYHTCLTQSLKS